MSNGGIIGSKNNASRKVSKGIWSLKEQHLAKKLNSWISLEPGTNYYVIPGTNNTIQQYVLPSPFDLDNKTLSSTLDVSSYVDRVDNLYISPDGFTFYTISTGGSPPARPGDILQFTLSEPYDLSTASLSFTLSNFYSGEATCFEITKGGEVLYINNNSGSIIQYQLSTPYDIRTRTQVGTLGGFPSDGPGDPAFSPDGQSVVIGRRSGNTIIGGTCSTPFDISTFNQTDTFTTSDADPSCCKWNNDGSKLFVRHASPDMVNEFSAITPYSLNGISFVKQVFDNPSFAAGGHDFSYSF